MATTQETYVSTSLRGGVAVVHLARPRALNALSPEVMEELALAVEECERVHRARAIVVAGDDRAFAAGADLKSMRDRSFETVLTHAANRFWARLAAIEVPLVAAVSGYALGGGFELALACDMIVASETAVFAQSEIGVGIVPGGGGTQRLARTIGKQRAMEMVLTGRRISAAEAERLGLVNRVVASGAWLAGAIELAEEVASQAPLAVRLAKRAVLAAEEAPMSAALSLERRLYELAMATEDRREGIDAFLSRRPAQWRGQ